MKDETILAGVGIVVLGAMQIYALNQGVNGQIFATVVSAITGIITGTIGFIVGKRKS